MHNEDINMLTCTPVLAGRKLGNMVPESPFLTANNQRRDATPMMKVQIRENGDSAQLNIAGGLVMQKVGGANA